MYFTSGVSALFQRFRSCCFFPLTCHTCSFHVTSPKFKFCIFTESVSLFSVNINQCIWVFCVRFMLVLCKVFWVSCIWQQSHTVVTTGLKEHCLIALMQIGQSSWNCLTAQFSERLMFHINIMLLHQINLYQTKIQSLLSCCSNVNQPCKWNNITLYKQRTMSHDSSVITPRHYIGIFTICELIPFGIKLSICLSISLYMLRNEGTKPISFICPWVDTLKWIPLKRSYKVDCIFYLERCILGCFKALHCLCT